MRVMSTQMNVKLKMAGMEHARKETTANKNIMERLNDDCQLLIIKFLELEDQLALFEAADHLSSRLNENMIYAWQRQYYYKLNTKKLMENPKYLNNFLRSIGPTVRHLSLKNVTFETMEPWRGHSFPSLEHLSYKMLEDNDNVGMKLLVELFPKLESLYPIGHFASSIAVKWTQLRELHILNDVNHLQMLEKISDPNRWIRQWINSLLSLSRLQIICFGLQYYDQSFVSHITEMRGVDIKQITFHDSIKTQQSNCIENSAIQLEELQHLVSVLPSLEQLHLINLNIFRSETDLWLTVALCPTLNLINISGMPLYAGFFAQNRSLMEKVLCKRSSVLTLCCYNTGCKENLVRQYFEHSKLKLSFENLCGSPCHLFCYRGYYKIQLLPLRE